MKRMEVDLVIFSVTWIHPPKTNGWHLKIHPLGKRRNIYKKHQIFVGFQPLVFGRGVFKLVCFHVQPKPLSPLALAPIIFSPTQSASKSIGVGMRSTVALDECGCIQLKLLQLLKILKLRIFKFTLNLQYKMITVDRTNGCKLGG